MSSKKHTNAVRLPSVPVGKAPQHDVKDEFWSQQGSSGAINAFRQLTSSIHKGGRKQSVLPGSKLQPLFKNYTAPPRLEGGLKGGKSVLPSITDDGNWHGSVATPDHVVKGISENLPKPAPDMVRIYLASNFKDMKAERAILMEKAVPLLQDFCCDNGLLFQLVDLNWGMNEDLTSSHENNLMRHREITKCQRLSIGCNFVVLLGDCYGDQNLVPEISLEDFDILASVINDQDLVNKELLNKYYKKDQHALPPEFLLEDSVTDVDLAKLKNLLEKAVDHAVLAGKLSENTSLPYTQSGLASDVQHGVLNSKNPRSCCMAYQREFRHLAKHSQTPFAHSFLDTINSNDQRQEVDMSKQRKHHALAEQLMQHLGVGNHKQYFLKWDEENGLNIELPGKDFQQYLEKFCNDFVHDIKHLVLQGIERKKNRSLAQLEAQTYEEALFHSQLLANLTPHPQGLTKKFEDLEQFLRNPKQNSKPYLISGVSGSGKSVMMGKLAKKVTGWFNGSCVVVFRCLGMSSQSSNILEVVRSITLQICMAYKLKLPSPNLSFGTLFDGLSMFRTILSVVSKDHAFIKPLFILLDGLDKLQPHDESLRSLWAIKDLPPNIHIIVSTVPKLGEINLTGALLTLVTDEVASTEVPDLNVKEYQKIIDLSFADAGRKCHESQMSFLLHCAAESSSPLDLNMSISKVRQLRSFEALLKDTPTENLKSSLETLFDAMEVKYGVNIVMFFAAYITAVPLGLHERHLLDLMTCNQDVMEEVRSIHSCDNTSVLLFPPRLFAMLKNDLAEILTEHFMYGQRVLAWCDLKVYFAIADKYSVIFPGMFDDTVSDVATSFSLMLHEHMANMFIGDNVLGNSRPSSQASNSNYMQVSVAVPHSKLNDNLIKLHQLPKHLKVLLPVEGVDQIKEVMLANYRWLMTKLVCTSPWAVMQDHYTLLSLTQRLCSGGVIQNSSLKDLDLLFEFFQLSAEAIITNPNNFIFELWGRLGTLARDYHSLKILLDGAADSVANCGKQVLIPLYPFLQAPGGTLRHTLPGCTHLVGFLEDREIGVMFSQKSGCGVVRLETGELLQRFPVNKEQILSGVIRGHHAQFVIIAHFSYLNNIMNLSVWSTETGVRLVHSQFPYKFDAIALDPSDSMLVVSSYVPGGDDMPPVKCLLGVDIHSKEVIYTIPITESHAEGITNILFIPLPDGSSNLLTLGTEKTKDLVFWNIQTETILQRLELPHFPDKLKYNAETNTVVAASASQSVLYVLNLATFQINFTIRNDSLRKMMDLHMNSEQILVATKRHGVQAFSSGNGNLVMEYCDPDTVGVPSVVITSEDDDLLFVGYTSGEITLFKMSSGETVTRLIGHSKQVNTLHLIDENTLISGADDENAIVWNIEEFLQCTITQQKEVDEVLLEEISGVSCFLLSPDGAEVITGVFSGPIRVWDIDTGLLKQTISQGIQHGVTEMYFAYHGKLLVGHVGNDQGTNTLGLKVWKLESGEELHFEGINSIIVYCSCIFPEREDRILTVSPASDYPGLVLSVYDLFEMHLVTYLHCNISGDMDCLNLSLLGCTTYTDTESTSDSLIKGMQKLYAVLDYHPQPSISFFFTFIVDGANLDKISMDHHEPIHLDCMSPKCCLVLKNGCCITGTTDGQIVAWDASTQKISSYMYDKTLSKALRQGKVSSKNHLGSKPAHTGAITCISVSADEKLLVTGATDEKIKIWNWVSRECLQCLQGHTDKILSLSLSSDYTLLASGSSDNSLTLWKTNDGTKITSAFMHQPVSCIAVSIKKQRVVAEVIGRSNKLAILKMVNFD